MSETEFILLEMIIGQVMPTVIDFQNKRIARPVLRFWFAVLTCFVAGALLNFDQFTWDNWPDILRSFLVLFFSAQAAYKTWYEGSQLQIKIRNPIIPS